MATGSFQPGIGGVGINPLVNTQFQYLDVGVNIDVTPRVHQGREVTLKISIDISSVTSYQNIGGISQPVIGQRKIDHEMRLKEGEVSLMGGILEDQQTKSLTGIPGLANIPILKYLFSQTNTDHSENEIVFALIPHIVRGPEVNELNQRMIEVGTANAIQLRPMSTKSDAPAASGPAQGGPTAPNANPGMAPQAPAPNVPAVPVPAPSGNPAASGSAPPLSGGGSAAFMFDPATITQPKGATFTMNINVSGVQNVLSVPLQMSYDPAKLELVNVSNGGFLSQDGQAVALVHRGDEATGSVQITATRPPGAGGVSGQGSVVTLTFLAKASGQAPVTIIRGGARDPSMQAIPVNGAQAVVTIQ